MKENKRNERNFTVVDAWVLGCYAVGSTVIISKASDILIKGCNKLIDKREAFELYKLVKEAVKYNCSMPQKKYDRMIELFQEEKEWVKSQSTQSVVVQNEMLKTLIDLETAFRGARLDSYSVILAEKYCENKVLIMRDWKIASSEKSDEKPFEKEREELRKRYEENLSNLGVTPEQRCQLDKTFDELFRCV